MPINNLLGKPRDIEVLLAQCLYNCPEKTTEKRGFLFSGVTDIRKVEILNFKNYRLLMVKKYWRIPLKFWTV
jgi:hypothetical protein